ncbi:MAG TPA: YciI family protein [Steroidobacteraceae bacterium]|nr:YciI family protein [Steroidobacteraceae bacterium]
MRVMVILKATASSEAGVMPSSEDIEAGIRFNEEMVKAGILKGADGIKPSKFGKRVTLRRNGKPSITDGPFAETKELVAGYWLWEVKSMDEALEWAKRCPAPGSGEESTIEIRPFFGPEDFGEEFTPEMQERVEVMHRHEAAQQK